MFVYKFLLRGGVGLVAVYPAGKYINWHTINFKQVLVDWCHIRNTAYEKEDDLHRKIVLLLACKCSVS